MKLWAALLLGIGAIALLAGAYVFGRADGRAIERDKQAAVKAATEAERAKRADRVEQIAGAAQQASTTRQENVREIYRESHTVTERPVYRNVCVDADGMRLLDRAAAAANGEDLGRAASGAAESATGKPQP